VLYRQRVMENGCCENPGKLIAEIHVLMRYQEKYHIKYVLANSDKLIMKNIFHRETQTNLSHKTSLMGKLR